MFVNHPWLGVWGLKILRPLLSHHPSLHKPNLFLQRVKQRGFQPETILDIGAHLGEWSRMAKSVFPQADLVMVEPQAEMKPFLDRLCARYPDSRWFQMGLGAEAGKRVLNIQDDFAGSSFLKDQTAKPFHLEKQREVPVSTVDLLIREHKIPLPDLVKIDVQGFELEVLKGAQECLGNTEVFIVESSLFRFYAGQPIFHEIIEFMADRNYLVYALMNLQSRPLDGALGQVDVCFAKQGSSLRQSDRWI